MTMDKSYCIAEEYERNLYHKYKNMAFFKIFQYFTRGAHVPCPFWLRACQQSGGPCNKQYLFVSAEWNQIQLNPEIYSIRPSDTVA